jgi:hypothetical protein
MAHNPETGFVPGRNKLINAVPAIEAHAKGAGLQYTIDLLECGAEPGGVIVVMNLLAVAAPVFHQIGWIG